jgi:hypothetical protein
MRGIAIIAVMFLTLMTGVVLGIRVESGIARVSVERPVQCPACPCAAHIASTGD